jgi:hypothetical protein
MSEEIAYEERYCAFVDILGFSGLINRLRDGTRGHLAIKRALETIHSPWSDYRGHQLSAV